MGALGHGQRPRTGDKETVTAESYDALRAKRASGSLARFVCALALVSGSRVLFETTGVVEGQIAGEPKGEGGFGYDPIFYYPPFGTTLGRVCAGSMEARFRLASSVRWNVPAQPR